MGSVTMKFVAVTSLVLLGIAVLAFVDGHGHAYSLDPATQCVSASDPTECERRIGVCRGMHRNRATSNHRAQYMARAQTCAQQLNITLPNFANQTEQQQQQQQQQSQDQTHNHGHGSHGGGGSHGSSGHGGHGHSQWRQWARENPEDKRRLMSCVHQGLGIFNADGTVNRTRMTEKINQMFTNMTEPALQQELVNRAQTCPQEANQRREYFRCVYMGCATS